MNHLNPIGITESILCVQLRNQSGFPAAERRLAEKMKPAKLQPATPTLTPAMFDPIANEDQPGYMPTVEVVRIAHDHFGASYLRRTAKRYVRRIMKRQCPEPLIDGMALDIACREILDANRQLMGLTVPMAGKR